MGLYNLRKLGISNLPGLRWDVQNRHIPELFEATLIFRASLQPAFPRRVPTRSF
jgi:hypothetical protein